MLQENYGYKEAEIHCIWECEWALERKTPEVSKYFLAHPIRPLTRLQPQKAVKAALTESYVLHCDNSGGGSGGENLHAVDMSSLFPHVAIELDFPVGPYTSFVGEQIQQDQLSFQPDSFYYNGKPYLGLLQARVVPPKNLLHPFLLTTIQQGKMQSSLAVLCRTCAEGLIQDSCTHTKQERALTDVWTSGELCFAVSQLQYEIVTVFEMMLYTEKAPFLQRFTSLLAFNKIRSAALPAWVDPQKDQDRQRHCDEINKNMKFEERIGKSLKIEDLQPSTLFRSFFKEALNRWLGHFSTNLEKRTATMILDNRDDLELYASREQVESITLINERYVLITQSGGRSKKCDTAEDQQKCQVSRKSCTTVGAMITATARTIMYTEMTKLLNKKAQILKIACDALFFSMPNEISHSLSISEAFGHWKNIYHPDEIVAISQMGVHNYSVVLRGQDNKLFSQAKCSGLTMTHTVANELNFDTYVEAVNNLAREKLFDFKEKKYVQVQRKTDLRKVTTGRIRKHKSIFSRNVLCRRIFLQDSFKTVPYGWTF